MPTLLDVQQAVRRALAGSSSDVAELLADGVAPDRIDIYRNTFLTTLVRALRLCYPAVRKLVGDAFFEGTADIFVREHLPQAAYLDLYGGEFSEFLEGFEPARGLPFLADVARLEWAVNRALHAPDAGPLDLQALAALTADGTSRIRLTPHPSVRWLRLGYPADIIWRAVLDRDDGALAALDLDDGPAHLLVERRATGVVVGRLDEASWTFGARLGRGELLQVVIDTTPGVEPTSVLAEHLASERFSGFEAMPFGESGDTQGERA